MSHFQLIHSTYFGPQGPKEAIVNKNPVWKTFFDHFPREDSKIPTSHTEIMKTVLLQIFTNFNNMWNNKSCFNKIFSRLISILINIHLAPKREQEYNDYKQSLVLQKKSANKDNKGKESEPSTTTIPLNKNSLVKKTRDEKRKIFYPKKESFKSILINQEKMMPTTLNGLKELIVVD
jgi:hypothetical protein